VAHAASNKLASAITKAMRPYFLSISPPYNFSCARKLQTSLPADGTGLFSAFTSFQGSLWVDIFPVERPLRIAEVRLETPGNAFAFVCGCAGTEFAGTIFIL
jgi:hypothetical protein